MAMESDPEEGIVSLGRRGGGVANGADGDDGMTVPPRGPVVAAEPTAAAGGAAAALALFAQQGTHLGTHGTAQPMAGRANDSKADWHGSVVPQIRLEYTDEYGRP